MKAQIFACPDDWPKVIAGTKTQALLHCRSSDVLNQYGIVWRNRTAWRWQGQILALCGSGAVRVYHNVVTSAVLAVGRRQSVQDKTTGARFYLWDMYGQASGWRKVLLRVTTIARQDVRHILPADGEPMTDHISWLIAWLKKYDHQGTQHYHAVKRSPLIECDDKQRLQLIQQMLMNRPDLHYQAWCLSFEVILL